MEHADVAAATKKSGTTSHSSIDDVLARFRRLCFAVLAMAGLLLAAGASAQDFPVRPVRFINPLPGGPVDASLRVLADRLTAIWKQPVIVEGKPGASEIIAGDYVAKAPADGYTILASTDSNFTNNQYVFAKLPFDPVKDLVPVTQLFDIPLGLIVRGSLDVNSVADFLKLMKKDGASYKYASTGVGGSVHLNTERFRRAAGFEMIHVPYKQASQIAQDLIGGSVDAAILSAQNAAPYIPDGKMKMLAISAPQRMKVLPNVPTFAEAGYPNVDVRSFLGLAVPKGTPPAIVEKISRDVRTILLDSDYQAKVLDLQGYSPVASSPAQFSAFLATRRIEQQKLIKELNIRLD